MGTSIEAMEAYISKLEMQIGVEKDKVSNLQSYVQKASAETQELIAKIRNFCAVILEGNIATGEIASSDIQRMSLNEMLEAAKNTYQRENVKTKEVYAAFAAKLDEKNTKIQSLTTMCSQLQNKLSRCTDYGNLDNPNKDPDIARAAVSIPNETVPTAPKQSVIPKDDDFMKALTIETKTQQMSPAQVEKEQAEQREKDKPKQSTFTTPIYGLHDLSKIESKITDLQWKTLEIIGTRGISEVPDIIDRTMLDWKGETPSKSTVRNGIKELVNLSVLSSYKVNTGLRWCNLCEFSTEGSEFYKERFGKPPVESEMAAVLRDHGSYAHGYGIKETAKTLIEELHFESAVTDRKANYIRISDKSSSIPDIIAVKDKERSFYEFECGTSTPDVFNDKCHKLMQITDKIYFVVPNVDVLNKLMNQIESWIASEGGRNKLAPMGIKVYLTNLRLLTQNIWRVEYDMSQEEPIITLGEQESSPDGDNDNSDN